MGSEDVQQREIGPTTSAMPSRRRLSLLIGTLVVLLLFPLIYFYLGQTYSAPTSTLAASRQSMAPDFGAASFAGDAITLSSFRGQPVVLNFWASWCPPCRAEARTLEKVWQAYADQDVVLLGVNVQDDESGGRSFLKEFGVTYPNVRDETGEIAAAYRIAGIPTTYFIDDEGMVTNRWVGPLSEQQLAARVEELLR